MNDFAVMIAKKAVSYTHLDVYKRQAVTIGEDRIALLQEAEKVLLQDDAALAPTFFQTRSFVSQDKVQGILRNGVGLFCDYKWAYIQ